MLYLLPLLPFSFLGLAQVDKNMAERIKGRGQGETTHARALLALTSTSTRHVQLGRVCQRVSGCGNTGIRCYRNRYRDGDTSGNWAKGLEMPTRRTKEGCQPVPGAENKTQLSTLALGSEPERKARFISIGAK